jgi:tetratricopeptide (TPR) repeat protein
VPPGPRRDLVDALHTLHHRAGWPSLRVLASEAGCSPTTVSAVFSSPRLPSWGLLELLVEAMDGDVEEFRALWQAAGSPVGFPVEPSAASARIAGRVSELATVRRHLTAGTPGLLLVTGEAGIGKTRLVETARAVASNQVFVAAGSCLPLSTDVPLLPIATLLRATYNSDYGQWLKEALSDAAPYVSASLRRLLPELDQIMDAPDEPDDEWSRQRLFTAIGTTLTGMAALRPLAVLIEDLHWADAMTLDLLEHLLATGPGVPVVGTWRQDDPTVPKTPLEWFTRVRRLPVVDELVLGPLTRDETAEQLILLTGHEPDPASVDRIHRRTAGQPLFTEQLTAQANDDQSLPDVLADLLDRRLDGLDEPAWRIARTLGVADRPLTDTLLSEVTTLPSADLAAGLHQLADRRLLHPTGDTDVQLRHPLLAEAIRRRLVRPESIDEHRRLAAALAGTADPSPSEVAQHWQRAGDPGEEITWRIRAARAAGRRFAAAQEGEQWLRVLDLWPEGSVEVSRVTLAGAYLAAMEALNAGVQFDRAADLCDEATRRLTNVDAVDRAALLARAANYRGLRESASVGLELLDQAFEIYSTLAPNTGYVQALEGQVMLLDQLGRFDDAYRVARAAVEAATRVGVPQLHRRNLAILAWHEAEAGHLTRALRTAEEAQALAAPGSDPLGDMRIGVIRTDILLRSGGSAEDVEAAGEPGLAAATSSGIDNFQAVLLRSNISEALTRAGFVSRAAVLIDPVTEVPFDHGRWPVHLERANLDAIRGRLEAAQDRLSSLRNDTASILVRAEIETRKELVNYAAVIDLWDGAPDRALPPLKQLLDEAVSIVSTQAASQLGQSFVLAARAAADIVAHHPQPGRVRGDHLRDLMELRSRAGVDPFSATSPADGPAFGASWQAETARLSGQPSLELWATAAREWDELSRPHDAAYCRWRGAQVAIATGQGTIALRLLRRAAREAREHVPLSTAIAETTERARRSPHPG